MTQKKIKLAIIMGGTNTEHEVSLVSAKSIISHLDKSKYHINTITIKKNGSWSLNNKLLDNPPNWTQFDVVFPVLHGPFGEDGTIQGMLDMTSMPYIGCGVLGSASCMDKVVQKDICKSYGIPIPNYLWITSYDWKNKKAKFCNTIEQQLTFPVFVKPANQGSSVGVTKVKSLNKLSPAIDLALTLDHKVIIEEAIDHAREIECSILGNDNPKASVLGEIISSNEFYDYDSKYIDGQSKEVIPAILPPNTTAKIRQLAIQAFKVLNCSGLARVDFLVNGRTGEYYLNELNTMPGFTTISMYPKLWEASELPYSKLLDALITLAIQRHQKRSQINYDYTPKTAWHEN